MSDERYPPIRDYALVSDSHSAGLISRHGSIDWACFRRFDAPSAFGRILDWNRGGHCSLRPVESEPHGRRYRGTTMVLETDHRANGSTGRTVDFFAVSEGADPREAAAGHPPHQLVRIAEGLRGRTEWELVCAPRFEYGIVHPHASLRSERDGLLIGGPSALVVDASVPMERGDGRLVARFSLEEGERAWFSLTWRDAADVDRERLDDGEIDRRLEGTTRYWDIWAKTCDYEGPHRDDVVRSALTLKALTNEPTGAIVAAPTTSLPEHVGGERNWDYRYCWIRDAAFTLYAGFILGYTSEARDFIDWLIRTTAGRADDLQVAYGPGGERLLTEVTLDHLEGYRGSRPVRIGNRATAQFQLDVYGAIVDTAHLWKKYGGEIDDELWDFLLACVRNIAHRWGEPDHGIWEVRDEPRHFVYSKAMAWVGVDRALRLAEATGREGPVAEWRALRDEIRREVLERGYNEELGAFVRSYGSTDLDASVLLLPLIGFIRADDPRMVSTVERIQKELTRDGLMHRYRTEDGLDGDEGAFTICSFWLVDNLAFQGRMEEARELFDHLCALSNDVGLYSEEVDPVRGDFLGNFPQAFTHLSLINAAINIQDRPPSRLGKGPMAEAAEGEHEAPAEGKPADGRHV